METSKAFARRTREGFFEKYIHGTGIDIGCGSDPLKASVRLFLYDKEMGHSDAELMENVSDDQFDFVYSSHCLEHLWRPWRGLKNWWRILKPGGYLIVVVPHRDLYEKRHHLPSRWNPDHKWFFLPEGSNIDTISLSLLLHDTLPTAELIYVKTCDEGYAANGDDHPGGEYSIEAVVRKGTARTQPADAH